MVAGARGQSLTTLSEFPPRVEVEVNTFSLQVST